MDEHSAPTGHLRWGIKGSFREYLMRQADFSLNVEDGATVGAGNAIHFPLLEQAAGAEGVVWATRGHAVFRAHGGMMRLSLRNPVVRQSGTDLLLAFDVGSGLAGAEPDYLEVARLVEVPSETPHLRTFQVFLLPGATGLFNDVYAADSELDAVTIESGVAS